MLLAIFYGGILIRGRKGMKVKWYSYLLLGIADVEANYLVVKAKYQIKKIVGVVICVAGIVLIIFSDVHASDHSQSGTNPVKGDLLAITGATVYAVCNVSEEFFMKTADKVELLAMLGLFGAIVGGIQICVLEREELKSIHWLSGAVLPYAGFAAAMFLFYSGVPLLLKISGSTMLNLSLLTSDMWSVLIRIFVYHEKVDWMYYVAFAAVAVGLIVYTAFDKEVNEQNDDTDELEKSRHFDEEADMAGSVKLNILARSSNAGDSNTV
ncbi:hypothetical protein R6Q59_030573 [Mikania micrantha]